ncbi:MAG TPA: hypothetical protein PLE43_06950 [Alphaproteobacteria bacterium]|nr:hypothetical protein [Alphaproteobacteria bacterium]
MAQQKSPNPAASTGGSDNTSIGMLQLEQAINEWRRASQTAEKNGNAANREAQKQAQLKVVRVATQAGILDETTEFGKAFAKIAPETRAQLIKNQQELGKLAGDQTLQLLTSTANDERSALKNQIDTLFGMEAGGMKSSIGFAGIGRAVCSFLRAIGVDGMDEYITKFDEEIRMATDNVRDVKHTKLKNAPQEINPESAERQVIGATNRALGDVSAYSVEAIEKASLLIKNTGEIGKTQPEQQTSGSNTGSESTSPVIVGTSRAVEIAKTAAKDIGLKDPKAAEQVITGASKIDGDPKNLSGTELAAIEARLITGEGKKATDALIERIKAEAKTTPDKYTSTREPALNLN